MKDKRMMFIPALALLVIAGFVFVWTENNKSTQKTQGQVVSENNVVMSDNNLLDVDDLAADPSAYIGKITVRGAVSFVYPSWNSFVIIDTKEYDKCGVVTCAINHLVVSYSKQLPKMKDRVEILGELIKSNGSYVLKADDVKVK